MRENNTMHAETILFNTTIATQNSHNPFAEAVAIANGNILAVGSSGDMLDLSVDGTKKIDLEGQLVVPGFIDSHIHFYEWAIKRNDIRLDDVASLEELLAKLKKRVSSSAPGSWVMGQGWNEAEWQVPVMPTRHDLDKVSPSHPVLFWRCDLHLAVANSAALKAAAIDNNTADPQEGKIERDESGHPTGILRELAINLVRRVIEPLDDEQIIASFRDATNALLRRGVTGIHDVRLMDDRDGARAFKAFQQLHQDQELKLRSWVSIAGHQLDEAISLGLRTGFGCDRLRIGHVKFFSDGGVGARTAWMNEPYNDADVGMPLTDMAEIKQNICKADRAGLSVMVHAIGDRANRELISVFESLEDERQKAGGARLAVPHRIEHVQVIQPQDVKRLSGLPVALCVTPRNMVLDINVIDTALGERGAWAYAFRQIIDTGAPVIFSSDCPVCDPAPLPAIHAAVTRKRLDNTPEKGWHPQECISVDEAVKAHTIVPAQVHGAADIGVIAPGAKADLAVLDSNIYDLQPEKIADAKVKMTIFDGKIVFNSDD